MLTGWEPSLSEGLQKFAGWKGHALLRVSALKWASAPSAFGNLNVIGVVCFTPPFLPFWGRKEGRHSRGGCKTGAMVYRMGCPFSFKTQNSPGTSGQVRGREHRSHRHVRHRNDFASEYSFNA